jgi:hypothetical protein
MNTYIFKHFKRKISSAFLWWGSGCFHIVLKLKEKEMKKVLFVFALALALAVVYPASGSFGEEKARDCGHVQKAAESGGQSSGDCKGNSEHGDMGDAHGGMHHGQVAGGEKLGWQGMAPHVVPMMKTMAGMSQMVADAMAKGMDDAKMEKVASIIDAMSSQMVRLYDMMNNKGATASEMHSLHMNINETERELKQIK